MYSYRSHPKSLALTERLTPDGRGLAHQSEYFCYSLEKKRCNHYQHQYK